MALSPSSLIAKAPAPSPATWWTWSLFHSCLNVIRYCSDSIKPHANEASLRLQHSAVAFLALVLLTSLLPLPEPWTSVRVVWRGEGGVVWWTLCAVETAFLGVLLLTAVPSLYALQFPRASSSRPTQSVNGTQLTPSASKRRLGGLSPNTSPQPQRSFSSSYTASPVSTPSRTLQYSASPLNSSASMSLPPTPSPMLSAFRGKHPMSAGRALDSSVLSQLRKDDSDDE